MGGVTPRSIQYVSNRVSLLITNGINLPLLISKDN